MAAATDEYGRAPQYVRSDTPGSPELRKALFGPTVIPRPVRADVPAFVNDQPES